MVVVSTQKEQIVNHNFIFKNFKVKFLVERLFHSLGNHDTKLWRQNISVQLLKYMIIIIASHCGCGCNRCIELIILAQEPCLNSTALLRYGLKSRVKFL